MEVELMDKVFYAVIGLLDDSSQSMIYEMWKSLEKNGLRSKVVADGLPPHITLAVYEDISEDLVLSWVEKFSSNEYQQPIIFNHIGIFFEQTIFIAPRVSEELLLFHKRFHSNLEGYHGQTGWLYTPLSNQWVPHVTIMHNSSEENKAAIPLVMKEFKTIKGRIDSLAVYKFYPADEVSVFPLIQI
jgi:2'-5' RNA ligase